ncbi:hypothetical protein J1N35_001351 [Gossypium stocksii]|uniref:Uncharacterized protein n=1 Tax=Gossypium stocksii TaxID=47602 RepID=A0A9D3WK92_9ROSI|nr:hypothetical protein J1N35_001351 [Gossypium stocksii]
MEDSCEQEVERIWSNSIGSVLEKLVAMVDGLCLRLTKRLIRRSGTRNRKPVNWLNEGDHNISFFQNLASKRRRVNRIKSLKDPDGKNLYDQEDLEHVATKFFAELFSS